MRKTFIMIGTIITTLGIVFSPVSSKASTYVQVCPRSCMNSNSCGDLNQFLQEYLAKNYPNLACYFNLTCPNQNTCANPTDHSCIPEVTPTIPEESASAPDEVITIPEESPTNSDEATENHDAPAGNPDDTGLPTYEEQVVALVNAERAKEGLPALKVDETLQAAALARAKETVQLFSHTRPNGTSCFTILKEYGISYRYAGENIAYGQRSPEEVVNAWMNSEGHRANIMNKNFTTIGIGYYQTANGTKYWSQLFLS